MWWYSDRHELTERSHDRPYLTSCDGIHIDTSWQRGHDRRCLTCDGIHRQADRVTYNTTYGLIESIVMLNNNTPGYGPVISGTQSDQLGGPRQIYILMSLPKWNRYAQVNVELCDLTISLAGPPSLWKINTGVYRHMHLCPFALTYLPCMSSRWRNYHFISRYMKA